MNLDGKLLDYMERFYLYYIQKTRNPTNDLVELNNGSVFTCEQYLDYERKLSDIARPPFDILSKSYSHPLGMTYRNESISFKPGAETEGQYF